MRRISKLKFKTTLVCLVIFGILFSTNLPLISLAQTTPDPPVELPGTVSPDLGVPASPPPGKTAPTPQAEAQAVIVLTPRNETAFKALAEAVSDPASARYRQPLTDSEYRRDYAPDPQTISDLKSYFAGQGLSLDYESSSGLVLSFKGTLTQRDKAFSTSSEYHAAATGETGLINVSPLKLPLSLSKNIKGVLGFDQLHTAHVHSVRVKPGATPNSIAPNSVSQNSPASLRAAYNFPANLNGSGTNPAIVLWGAPDLNDTNRWKAANAISGTVTLIPATASPASDDNTRFEANMDVQLTLTAAPNANLRFYVSTAPDYGSLGTTLQKAVDDNVSTLSGSWGGCEQFQSNSTLQAYTTIFQNAAAKGIPVFFSSGDSGAFECNPNGTPSNVGYSGFPASDPLVTSVGGTALDRNTSTNAWQNETAWSCIVNSDSSCLQSKGGASEGGAATTRYPRPAFQAAVNPAAEPKFTNPAANTRLQPDISTNGDPKSGEVIYIITPPDLNGCTTDCYLGGGTSASTPFLAGIAALAVQKKGGPVGGLNNFIYSSFSANWGYDVMGGYTGVPARAGWDYTTGKGSIKDVTAFLNAFIIPAPYLTGSIASIIELTGNNNGVIDPGETIGLKISLANTGSLAATGVSGSLSLTGGTANITGATASYPDIASNTSAANNANYVFSLNYTQACGGTLAFRLTITSNSSLTYIYNFTLKIGTAQAVSYSANPQAAIPDNNLNGLNSVINVPAVFSVADVNVTVNITHSFDSDLILKLIAPDNTTIILSNKEGGSGHDYTGTTFDSQAVTPITSGASPFTGSFQPEQSLDGLNNKPVNGNWTLNVADTSAIDTGTLNSWSLALQSTYSCTVYNPVPVLSSLSQNSALVGSGGFTLTLNGANFALNSVVRWNGGNRTTTFINSGQLQAQIPASDFTSAGIFQVTVFNPAPGGGSAGLPFTVNNLLPSISGLLPANGFAGGSGFTLTVNGSNFVNGAKVLWNGSARPTGFVNSGQLTAQISSQDIAASGAIPVIVQNPAPGGGNSTPPQTFNITNTTPLVFSTYPDAVPAQSGGGPAFSLTLNGAYFVNGSTAYWNGAARPTTYINSSQLIVTIGDGNSDLATAGKATLTVTNPTPGGGPSSPFNFTISATCLVWVVTNLLDTNTCGTLRNAVTKASNVYLALNTATAQTIILGSPAFSIPGGVAVYGVCKPTGPAITLAGAGTASSLTLGGGNVLFGLKLVGFGGPGQPQLKVLASAGGGAAKLNCTSISKQ